MRTLYGKAAIAGAVNIHLYLSLVKVNIRSIEKGGAKAKVCCHCLVFHILVGQG